MEILCFYAGIAFVYASKCYALLLVTVIFYCRPKRSVVLWFLAAIAWGMLHQEWVASRGMPKEAVIQQAQLTGQIISIPVVQGDRVQFSFAANRLNGQPVQTNIAMACYNHCPELHAGQSWRLIAKLKKPRNLGNPGGFDYVGWLSTRHIHWSGSVKRGSFEFIDSHSPSSQLLQFREHLCDKLALLNPDIKTLGIIEALTLGISSHIDKAEWDLFRHTGTTHLIDISGAHIGLVAGITFTIVGWIWSRMGSLSLYWPAHRVAGCMALLIAISYTFLSGFSVPAQRALIACTFMLLRYFCNQRFTVWQAWCYALLAVLVLEPHSVMQAGFYLSFIGVAILVLTNQRIVATGVRKMIALQLACLAGLMPLTLYWFSYGAVNGILANVFAIPWVELWIVPLGLLTTMLPHCELVSWMMFALKHSISLLLFFLNWVDSFAAFNITLSFNNIASPLALMAGLCVCIFLPILRLAFPIGVMMIAALIPYHLKVKQGAARIDVMDVGQGLAVVVNTANHVLIYDTGVQFFQGSDMAKIAIIPYLKMLGIKKLDKVVISHPDLDHRGGLKSLEESYSIQELIVDDPAFYHRGSPCHDYPSWNWDGVSFRFFAIHHVANSKNNHSCVLQISTLSGQVLLTGDIEKPAEDDLVATYGHQLASSVMVIPHHASKTSSTSTFVENVSPRYAIVSYGFDNRYHFPHQQALRTYEQHHIPVMSTVACGMVSVLLDSAHFMLKPSCHID